MAAIRYLCPKVEQDFNNVLRSKQKFNEIIHPFYCQYQANHCDYFSPTRSRIRFFRCAKLAENAGYGFDKMLVWKKETNREVLFESDHLGATVTFMLKGEKLPQWEGGQKGGPEKNKKALTETQFLIVEEIRKNPNISQKSLSEMLTINLSAVQNTFRNYNEPAYSLERGGHARRNGC